MGLSGAVRMMNEGRARLHITLLSVWERLLKVLKSAGQCSTMQPRPTAGVERRRGVVKRGEEELGGEEMTPLPLMVVGHVRMRSSINTGAETC